MRSVGVAVFCLSLASSALAQAPVDGAGNRKQATAARVPNGSIRVDGRLDDEAWQKAAPLSKDGETYLNLARVLWQEGRIPEAKVAARAALDKGLKKPDDAKKIIALP